MNSKGFITISFLFFLPLMMSLSFAALFYLWLINQKHSLDNICAAYALDSQSTLVQGNNKLLGLNPIALSLIQRKRVLNSIIATAPPQLKALAQAQKTAIIAQQNILRLKQNSILQHSNFKSKNHILKLNTKLRSKFLEIGQFWNQNIQQKPTLRIHWVPSQIKIKVRDIAPTYERSLNHSEKQKIYILWSYPLKKNIPLWFLNFVPVSKNWLGHCLTVPQKEALNWIAKIKEDKQLLRP